MKIRKDADGLYVFDYEINGMFFIGIDRVAVLDRKTGDIARTDIASLAKTLKPKDLKRIESDLLMTNLYTDGSYQVMGIKGESV